LEIPTVKKLTPVLCVDSIEPCLEFWVNRLGFKRTVEVPEGNTLGFVILEQGSVEVMLQSRDSLRKDMPSLAEKPFESSGVALFVEVDDLDPLLKAVRGYDIAVPERTTFYGMREIGVRAPGGFLIVFAARVSAK
jgi:hypothetical protein